MLSYAGLIGAVRVADSTAPVSSMITSTTPWPDGTTLRGYGGTEAVHGSRRHGGG